MTREQAIALVMEVIKEEWDEDKYTVDSKLSDLGDSLDFVELTIGIEEKVEEKTNYEINFPDDLSRFKTIEDVVQFLVSFEDKQ